MPSAVDNIIKAAKSAATTVADKYGEPPTKYGEARVGAKCRREVLAAAVEVMTDKQKATVAAMGVEQSHLLIAAILIAAKTTLELKTAEDQITVLKESECISQDGTEEIKRSPSWPTYKDLQRLVNPPQPKAKKPKADATAADEAPAAKTPKAKTPKAKPPKAIKRKLPTKK